MNPILLWNLYSFRHELKYVALVFLFVLLLPIVAILVATQTGIDVVSDSLAEFDEVTQVIQLKNPLNGSVYKEISGTFLWPTAGVITLEFGESSIYQPFHAGIDIAGKRGDPVAAFMKGTVTYAGGISWGYGNHVIIDHGDNISSTYAHLSKIYVSKGDPVEQGQIIGIQGDTGWATGPHLHFETRLFGIPVNPRVFLGSSSE